MDKISHGQTVKGQSIFGLKLPEQNIAWTFIKSIWTNVFGLNLYGLNICGPKNCERNTFGHKSYGTKLCTDKIHLD